MEALSIGDIQEWAALDEENAQALDKFGADVCEAAIGVYGADYAASALIDEGAYCGEWASERAFIEGLIADLGMMDDWPGTAIIYFDYDSYTRDLFMTDYVMDDHGHVFRKY